MKKRTMIGMFVFFTILLCGKMNISAEAKEITDNMKLVKTINVDEKSQWEIYVPQNNISTLSMSASGKSYYMVYKFAGVQKVVIKHTVGFTYGYSDGKARATTNTYTITKQKDGFKAKNITPSSTTGNPATAKLSFSVYDSDNNYRLSITNIVKCYNNGNIIQG